MNARLRQVVRAVAILISGVWSASAALVPITDTDASPNTFECYFTAMEKDVTIGTNTNVKAMIYRDSAPGAPVPATAGIPVPLIKVKVGDTIICHLTNKLSTEFASIHWHGIELDNDSDGTAVTQDALKPGQTYTYRYKTFRPGLFWFHSHMMPGNTTFAGMYGVILIENNIEGSLRTNGVLPALSDTHTLALSDIDFNPADGFVGKLFQATTTNWLSINDLVEKCHLEAIGDNSGDRDACGWPGFPGKTVLVNGDPPNATNVITVPSGKKIRLHLMNEAIARHFRLTLLNSGNTNLYRIGGQGGLLNRVRLEGGILGTNSQATNNWDTGYGKGEIAIGSGDRADVIIVPSGTNGQIIQLVGNPLPSPFNLSGSTIGMNQGNLSLPNIPDNYPLVYFKISGTSGDTAPAAGDPILANTTEEVTSLKSAPTNSLTDPVPLGLVGTTNSTIRLLNNAPAGFSNSVPNVDNFAPAIESNTGNGKFLELTNAPSTRYARVGDLLELTVRNQTPAVHPFHLHGFSMQPVRIMSNAGNTLYNYDYNEFLDTIDVYPGQSLVFRVRLDFRPRFCDESPDYPSNPGPVLAPCTNAVGGGAVGRWLYHCHIFLHAGLGMAGEVVVLDALQQTNFFQHPDLTTNGVDVLTTTNTGSQTVADDFRCTTNGPITGISVWGSWKNDLVDTNTTFELKFWTDVSTNYSLFSRPGWQMWRRLFPPGSYTATLASSGVAERFYDPSQTNLFFSDTNVHRYDFVIPLNQAFYQYSSNVHWLSVSAYSPGGRQFGWKSSLIGDRWNDDAVWSPTLFGPHWSELHYPPGNLYAAQSMDMAFALNIPTSADLTADPLSPAAAPQPPLLSVTTSGGGISISWQGGGILQYADEITGPWTDIQNATNPYPVATDQPKRFYRVLMPSAQ